MLDLLTKTPKIPLKLAMDTMKLPENIWSVLRHGTLNPKCCEEHKVACSQSKNINVSRWKFPVREGLPDDKRFDPWTRCTKLHQKENLGMKEFDDVLEQLKMQSFLQQFTAAVDPEIIGKIADLLDIQLPYSSYEKVECESLLGSVQPPSDATPEPYDESLMPSDKVSPDDQSKSSEASSRNPYLALLKRLRQKELEQKFPDQELMAVKKAEEELQQATVEFCQWSKTLGEVSEKESHRSDEVEEDSDVNQSDKEAREAVFDVKSLRRMFYVAYGKPLHCPHIPTVVREPTQEPAPLQETPKEEKEKKMHVAWYLPPKIWFKIWAELSADESTDYTMTSGEIALASSYTVKKYVEYLEKNNLEPPRGLVELMKKQKKRLLEENNDDENRKTGRTKT